MKCKYSLMLAAISLLLASAGPSAAAPIGARKRLLEYGWDRPDAAFAKAHLHEMEQRPFDGVILALKSGGSLFRHQPFDAAAVNAEFGVLAALHWTRFTDNFIVVHAATDDGWDWFNDRDWAAAEANVRLVAAGVQRAGLRGICFDPEPYGRNPWQYTSQPSAAYHTYPEVAAEVRKRGRALMLAVQETLPHPLWFTFFQLSVLQDLMTVSTDQLGTALAKAPYGLLVPFVEGMLSAAADGTRIVDGDEEVYYAENAAEFFRRYQMIHARAAELLAPEFRSAYSTHVQVAQSVFFDHLMALRDNPQQEMPARYMSDANRLKFLQQNIYYAMYSSDEYAWLYSQKIDWWRHPVPPSLDQAIRWVRDRARSEQPLGFDLQEEIRTIRTTKRRGAGH